MADATPLPAAKLKDEFVPFAQRESQNVGWTPFLWRTAKFFIVAKLGGFFGGHVGKALGAQSTKFGIAEINQGTWIGGALGGLYEGYSHWRETKGKQLRVNDISGDLHKILDPARLEKQMQKEHAVIGDLQALKAALGKPGSHAGALAARREAEAQNPAAER